MAASVDCGTMHRKTVAFALISAVLLVIAATVLSTLYRSHAEREMEIMAERNNAALARVFANTIWADIARYLVSSEALTSQSMRSGPEVDALNRRIEHLIKGSSVVEVTIYDLHSRIVYSTDDDEIGEIKEHNLGLAAARAGRVASVTVRKDHLDTLEGRISNRDVVESYIPLFDPETPERVIAVFEIYDDVTEILHEIGRNQIIITGVVSIIMLLVYVSLVAIVGRGGRRIAREHAENLRLSAAIARSDAANQAKSEFLANMSHELRTPLNAIIGFSEIMEGEMLGRIGTPQYKEYARDIHASGLHLLGIVNDILDIARAEAGKLQINFQEISVAEIVGQVERVIRPQALAAGVAFTAEVDGEFGPIISDEVRLRQILLNLLSNAVKFTPAGGRVTLAARRQLHGVQLEITDTGIGIASADMPKALAFFGQVDSSFARIHEGTGLGLPLAKRITELLGGTLHIASVVGEGTRVQVTLPIRRLDNTALAASAEQRRAA
jgi:signal transduction histidine kinase